jgi:hypothetical protein
LCISLSTWIAPPVECSVTIVHRRDNTITLLCHKHNIMLNSVLRYLGFFLHRTLAVIESVALIFNRA